MVDPIITRTGPEVEVWDREGQVWQRLGAGGPVIAGSIPTETIPGDTAPPPPPPPPPPPTGSRSNLVTGTYIPDNFTTGVLPGINRSVYTGVTTLTTNNQIFTNMDFYKRLKIQATGVQFYNCFFYGETTWPTGVTGIVDCRSGSVLGAVTQADPWKGVPYFQDCTFRSQRPSYNQDGIMGSFYAKRCHVYEVNDGFGIYNTSTTTGAHAKVEACYVHDLVYWYPEPAHPDGTHNDGIQIQSGGDIHIIGNFINGTAKRADDRQYADPDGAAYAGGALSGTNPDKPNQLTLPNGPHINGSCIIIQRNTGIALSNSVVCEKNWFKQGGTAGNLKDGTYIYRDNIVYRGSFYYYSGNPASTYPIRPTSAATGAKVTGLYDSNRWHDTLDIMTEANGGIKY